MNDNILKRRFKTEIKKYQAWCTRYGYKSSDTLTLLWYFNQSKKAYRNNGGYYIKFRQKDYQANELIDLFKLENGGNK